MHDILLVGHAPASCSSSAPPACLFGKMSIFFFISLHLASCIASRISHPRSSIFPSQQIQQSSDAQSAAAPLRNLATQPTAKLAPTNPTQIDIRAHRDWIAPIWPQHVPAAPFRPSTQDQWSNTHQKTKQATSPSRKQTSVARLRHADSSHSAIPPTPTRLAAKSLTRTCWDRWVIVCGSGCLSAGFRASHFTPQTLD